MTNENSKNLNDLFELLAQSDMTAFAVMEASKEYVASSEDLLAAAMLVDGDDIKIEMITHLHLEFEKIVARDEGMKASLQNEYDRDFILQEMKTISEMNRSLAAKLRKKLEGLHNENEKS